MSNSIDYCKDTLPFATLTVPNTTHRLEQTMRGTVLRTYRRDGVSVLTICLIIDDIDNQSAASLAKLVDPNGERTVGECYRSS